MVDQSASIVDHVTINSCLDKYTLDTLEHMQQNSIFTDATLILDDGTKFSVHRILLSAASEYFKKLLQPAATTHNNTNIEIPIRGVASSILQSIISYIYARKISLDHENILDLIETSELLQIPSLVKLCSHFLMTKFLNTENSLFLMTYAGRNFQLGAGSLYAKIRSYVLKEFMQVAQTDYLLYLSAEELYDIITDDMLNVKNEEVVWRCCLRWISYNISDRMKCAPMLIRGVRVGLLDKAYFKAQVEQHPYLSDSKSAENLIKETLSFWKGDDLWNMYEVSLATPEFAVPRLPHEVLFAIGGQIGRYNNVMIETYDLRSDRWVDLPQEISGKYGPRCYHGSIVIGKNIYCIGGFDGQSYLSSCQVFNTVEKVDSVQY